MAADRKGRQEAYADLVRRANAGEAVDYGRLRAESIYAKDWDFYGSKARGLLDQAAAAIKGKDYPQALAILDQLIQLDFTVDAAHALRADGLRHTGQDDKARIEDGIAKGLIHSLMDSGKGDSEQLAYVVVSYGEEMNVLANRHIQLKTRQTEIRGSNGRYYDLIHGLSISAGSGQIETTPKDVYFDITSFVEGRASQRAAVQVLAAQLQ
jgi:hypothetical protein